MSSQMKYRQFQAIIIIHPSNFHISKKVNRIMEKYLIQNYFKIYSLSMTVAGFNGPFTHHCGK